MHIPPGFAVVTPYLVVEKAEPFILFLKEGLGGEEIGRTTGPDGRIIHSQVKFGPTVIMLGEELPGTPPSRASLYLFVEDAAASVERALKHGGILKTPITDQPYGDRQAGIVDPSGNTWWISQRLTAASYY